LQNQRQSGRVGMMKINTVGSSQRALITMVTLGVFGSLTAGCLPTTGKVPVTQYDSANYQSNTDSSGIAGTWLITYNNEGPADSVSVYGRDLVRVKPVEGTADSYEVTYCDQDGAIQSAAETISDDNIQLPVSGGEHVLEWTTTSNGRLVAQFALPEYSGGGVKTFHGVRLSGNPALDAGTVAIDYASDSTGAIRQPTACFFEFQIVGYVQDLLIINNYTLATSGTSASGTVKVRMENLPTFDLSVETSLNGSDSTGHSFGGPYVGNINTAKSTIHGITGTISTLGNENPADDGSAILKIKL
jgi:hypothetical protein